MITRKQTVILVSTIAILALLGTSASASGGGPPKLVGSWEVLSTVDGTTEAPSLHTYGTGGTYIASSASPANGNAHGAWERIGPRTYSSTEIAFVFGPTGEIIGTFHANATVTVALGGQSYDADFEGEVRLNNGSVLPFSGTAAAIRIGVND